eukprot:797210-Rhodomonas_salina.4
MEFCTILIKLLPKCRSLSRVKSCSGSTKVTVQLSGSKPQSASHFHFRKSYAFAYRKPEYPGTRGTNGPMKIPAHRQNASSESGYRCVT